MILEEHTFDLDDYQELDINRGVVDGKRVELLERRSDAVEFGARGKNALEGFKTLAGYKTSDNKIVVYATEQHSEEIGLHEPAKSYELPFDSVMPGSKIRPWQYNKEKSLGDITEESSEEILENLGIESSNPKNVVSSLLSLPINYKEDELEATSEIYVKGDKLDFDGDPEPLIGDIAVETSVDYPRGREAHFYHAEPAYADLLKTVAEDLDLISPEVKCLKYDG